MPYTHKERITFSGVKKKKDPDCLPAYKCVEVCEWEKKRNRRREGEKKSERLCACVSVLARVCFLVFLIAFLVEFLFSCFLFSCFLL